MVQHHLAMVKVAGSSPACRSGCWPSGEGSCPSSRRSGVRVPCTRQVCRSFLIHLWGVGQPERHRVLSAASAGSTPAHPTRPRRGGAAVTSVLVLNASCERLHHVPLRRAVALLLERKAELVEA